jgi:hypothetical protein
MSRPGLLAALLAPLLLGDSGCAGAPQAVAPPPAPAPPPPPPVVAGATSLGPIEADTPGNLAALRETLRGFKVRPVNDGMFDDLHFAVSRGSELLFYVIPADDGAIFNVHIMSPTVVLANKPWRAGGAFTSPDYLSHCECWGAKPVCYRRGEHIAAAFDRDCDPSSLSTAAGRRVLRGARVHRAVWNPKPFDEGPDPDAGDAGGDPCDGAGADPCAGP